MSTMALPGDIDLAAGPILTTREALKIKALLPEDPTEEQIAAVLSEVFGDMPVYQILAKLMYATERPT